MSLKDCKVVVQCKHENIETTYIHSLTASKNTRSVSFVFSSVHFEFRSLFQCLLPTDLYSSAGSSPSKLLNSTEFALISPFIVYCLLPAPEKNPGRCELSPKNHSELFRSFARNFSQHGEPANITLEALDHILEEVNKTIGQFLTRKKVGK